MPTTRMALATCLLAGAASLAALPVSHLDDRCRDVALAEPPQRIVALLPFYSEILLEVTGAGRIVGIGESPDTPAELAAVPSVGPAFSASREAIVALRPDLVLGASDWSGLRSNLETAGVAVFTVGCFAGEPDFGSIRNHDDVFAAIRAISLLATGDPQPGEHMIDRLRAEIAAVAEAVANRGRPSVAVLYPDTTGVAPPTSAGALTPELAAVEAAGGVPAVEHAGYEQLSPERLVSANPDYIVADGSHVQQLRSDPRLASLAAVREGRVCAVPASAWNSSQLGETVRLLAAILHPDLGLSGSGVERAADACRS